MTLRRLPDQVRLAVLLVTAASLLPAAPGHADPRPVELVLVSAGGDRASGADRSEVSADGRLVAFVSDATKLVAGDRNELPDVFVTDLATRKVERVSAGPKGVDGVPDSSGSTRLGAGWPRMTPDGRYVAFHSDAANLAAGDGNRGMDVFVRDRRAGTTQRVAGMRVSGALTVAGGAYPTISDNGRLLAFEAKLSDGSSQLVLVDRVARTGQVVSRTTGGASCPAGTASSRPAVSGNGRYVAFSTTCHTDGSTLAVAQVYVYDKAFGTRVLASTGSAGTPADQPATDPQLSADGKVVAFASPASNLVPASGNGAPLANVTVRGGVFVRDLTAARTELVSVNSWQLAVAGAPVLSRNGRFVGMSAQVTTETGPPAGAVAAWVHDRVVHGTRQLFASGPGAGVGLSGDGRYAVFSSTAADLVAKDDNKAADVFWRDLGPALGVAGVAVTAGPQAVTGGADVHYSGELLAAATDADDSVEPSGVDLGAELTGVQLGYERESGWLTLRWQLASLPTPLGPAQPQLDAATAVVSQALRDSGNGDGYGPLGPFAGMPGVVYAMRLTTSAGTYEVRGQVWDPYHTPFRSMFGLYKCTTACPLTTSGAIPAPGRVEGMTHGSIGRTGVEVRAVVALSSLGLAEGGSLTGTAFVLAEGPLPEGPAAPTVLDQAALPGTITLPVPQVTVTVSSPSTPQRAPVTARLTPNATGRVSFSVPAWKEARGRYVVQLTTCAGTTCTTERRQLS